MLQPLLSVTQAAPFLGLAPQTIYNRLSSGGDLPSVVRNGRLPQFLPEDIAAWREAKRAPMPTTLPAIRTVVPRRRGRPTKGEQILLRRKAAADDRPPPLVSVVE